MSVVMPAYNSAEHIAEAIGSVASQTYPNWELIVVDDGSTDDTLDVVRGCGVPEPRLRILRPGHGGPGAARNHGIDAANGELVAFLDSDDRWEPGKLTSQVAAYVAGRHDVIVSDWYLLGARGESRMQLDAGVHVGRQLIALLWDHNRFPPSVVLARRAALTSVGMFATDDRAGAFAEDYDLWLRLARAGCSFFAIREPACGYRPHVGYSSRSVLRMREADVAVLSAVAEEVRRADPARYRRRMANLHNAIVVLRAQAGDRAGARRALVELRHLEPAWRIRAKRLALRLLGGRYAWLLRRIYGGGGGELFGAPPDTPPPRS